MQKPINPKNGQPRISNNKKLDSAKGGNIKFIHALKSNIYFSIFV